MTHKNLTFSVAPFPVIWLIRITPMADPAKVMLVDDDAEVRGLFSEALRRAGFRVCECKDGSEALARIELERPALIVLDVEMPKMNGWKTLTEIRRQRRSEPVLMITHVNDPDSRVHGLEHGADDYVGKPCSAQELVARVRALLRRAPLAGGELGLLRMGEVLVDLDRKSAESPGGPLRLTKTEYSLLRVLRENIGAPVSRERIFAAVWGGREGNSHTLDTHIWRLRQKLGDTGDEPRWISNRAGLGYVLAPEAVENSVRS